MGRSNYQDVDLREDVVRRLRDLPSDDYGTVLDAVITLSNVVDCRQMGELEDQAILVYESVEKEFGCSAEELSYAVLFVETGDSWEDEATCHSSLLGKAVDAFRVFKIRSVDRSYQRWMNIFGFFLPSKLRREVYEPSKEELIADFLDAKKHYRTEWSRTFVRIALFLRTGVTWAGCLRCYFMEEVLKLFPRAIREWLAKRLIG